MTARTSSEILVEVRDALLADTVLNAWCTAQFSKSLTVYIGIDEDKPPSPADFPIVAITDISERQNNPGNRKHWSLDIGAGLYNETVDTSVPNAVIYTGFTQCEEFRDLVESALIKARIGKVRFQGQSEKISEYPVFVSYTTCEIEKIITRRNR